MAHLLNGDRKGLHLKKKYNKLVLVVKSVILFVFFGIILRSPTAAKVNDHGTILSITSWPTQTRTLTFTPRPTITPKPTWTSQVTNTSWPTLTRTLTFTPRPTVTPKPTWTAQVTNTSWPTLTRTLTFTPRPTITPKPTWTAQVSITPWPTQTRTPTLTPRPTFTAKPTHTPKITPTVTASSTSSPTVTSTLIPTLTPTPTLDVAVKFIPDLDNFEIVAGYLAEAINAVNATQQGTAPLDITDWEENYNDFNRNKYEETLNGTRHYKYLSFTEYRRNVADLNTFIRATVYIPDDDKSSGNIAYLNGILRYLHDVRGVDVSKITEQQKKQIVLDIGEGYNRLTCVKSLRLLWALFGDNDSNGKGLFPPIYQLKIINAGDLAYQLANGNGKAIFSPENMGQIKISLIKNAFIINEIPYNRPDLFDKKVMVFFKPALQDQQSGHVGVGKLEAEYEKDGKLKKFLISAFEVDGYTGQAMYHDHMDYNQFVKNLFVGMNSQYNSNSYRLMVGWVFNR